ncbi:MAG: nicotinate-nucleotide diphosphorylase (carboxylating) [Micavibrio sp.]|nr:MAG: nicotinate-nucleotide diphosphorylase (carboxylating) [Micavibrio sp.]
MSGISRTHEYLVRDALKEDLDKGHDVTSQNIIPDTHKTKAIMRARESGVLAGIQLAETTFFLLSDEITFTRHAKDGDKLDAGQYILTIEGPTQSILIGERTALNFLTHLSGIATLTYQYVEAIQGTKAKILDTRKTIPCLRALQKYAVAIAGGSNHRMGLYDAVLIKDNHIAVANGIKPALDAVKGQDSIEIEVDTLLQLEEVLSHGGADIVLLDNMDVETLKKAVQMAQGKIKTEASGGVNLETVRAIAETGVDYISIGALTHSAPALDIGLDIDA